MRPRLALTTAAFAAIEARRRARWRARAARRGREQARSIQRVTPIRTGDVVVIGDDHVAAADWSALLRPHPVAARGIVGDTARDVRRRIDEVVDAGPVAVAVLAGGADLAARRARADTVHDLAQIVDRIQLGSPDTRVILHTVPPRDDRFADAVGPLNDDVWRVARDRRVSVVDLHAAVADPRGRLRRDLTNDGIGLLGPAYVRWRDLLVAELGRPVRS